MHSAGASGAFAHGPARSIFAKPEGWTPPASDNNNNNLFRPVIVPTSSGYSGNPDWAKRFATNQNANDDDDEEEEEEDAEGEDDDGYEEDETFNSYRNDADYNAEARDLSDLDEADEEYEVVDD